MSIRDKILLSQCQRNAVNQEAAAKMFYKLEEKRIAIQKEIDKLSDSQAPIRKIMPLRHKAYDYDEVMKVLAEKANIDYQSTKVPRLLNAIERAILEESEAEKRRLRISQAYNQL